MIVISIGAAETRVSDEWRQLKDCHRAQIQLQPNSRHLDSLSYRRYNSLNETEGKAKSVALNRSKRTHRHNDAYV